MTISVEEAPDRAARPAQRGITVTELAGIFGVSVRRASRRVDRLPQDQLDRLGRERVVPLWLARKHWPNTFRDAA